MNGYHLYTTSNNVLFSHLAGGTWYRLTEEHVSGEYCKRNRDAHLLQYK